MTNKSERTDIELTKQELKLMKETNEKDHAQIKKDICDVKAGVDKLDSKLDAALSTKANKEDVDRLDNRFWGILLLLLTLALGVIFAIFK